MTKISTREELSSVEMNKENNFTIKYSLGNQYI